MLTDDSNSGKYGSLGHVLNTKTIRAKERNRTVMKGWSYKTPLYLNKSKYLDTSNTWVPFINGLKKASNSYSHIADEEININSTQN